MVQPYAGFSISMIFQMILNLAPTSFFDQPDFYRKTGFLRSHPLSLVFTLNIHEDKSKTCCIRIILCWTNFWLIIVICLLSLYANIYIICSCPGSESVECEDWKQDRSGVGSLYNSLDYMYTVHLYCILFEIIKHL